MFVLGGSARMAWCRCLLLAAAVNPASASDAVGDEVAGSSRSHTSDRLQIAADTSFPPFDLAGDLAAQWYPLPSGTLYPLFTCSRFPY